MTAPAWLTAAMTGLAGIVGGSGGMGIWSYLTAKSKAQAEQPQQMISSTADMQRVVNEAATEIVESLRTEVRALRHRVEELETEVKHLKGQWPKDYPLPAPPHPRPKRVAS